jgi:receptor protein-tyrosine kinase
VLLITSPSPQDGKSTILSNLGIALAEIGQRVLLIDGDMRLPRLHTIFDIPNTFGLSDILSERVPVGEYSEDVLVRRTAIPGLDVIPAGPARAQLSRLLYSPRMKELIERSRLSYDIILIDSAPVLSVPDSRILALAGDGVILVVRAHKTPSTAAAAAAARFEEDGRPVLGTILNDWNPKVSSDSSYRAYYSSYSQYYRVGGRS